MTKHAAEQAFDLMPSPTLTCMPPQQHSPRFDKAQPRAHHAKQVHLILYPHVRSRVLRTASSGTLFSCCTRTKLQMLTPEELGSQHAQDDDDDHGFFKVSIYTYLEEAMVYVYPYIHDAQDDD